MDANIYLLGTTKEKFIEEILVGVESLLEKSKEEHINNSEWLTTKEVLQFLKVTPVTLWNYDQKGLTKPQKIGNRKRYAKSEILNLLSRRKHK